MESIKRSNKVTLIAAALLITVAISVFGVSADESTTDPQQDFTPYFEMTDEQKAVIDEAHELMKEGDFEGAKELLEEAGIEDRMMKGRRGRDKNPENRPDCPFLKDLTDEQKAVMDQAHARGEQPEGFRSFRQRLPQSDTAKE
jgi:predicted DNA binding protein